MNISSKLWKVVSFNDGYVQITQKASGVTRSVSRGLLPSVEKLAAMTENQFNAACRKAFH